MKKLSLFPAFAVLLGGAVFLLRVESQGPGQKQYRLSTTPEGLHKTLDTLLGDLDRSAAAIPFGEKCDDTTKEYKDYELLVEVLKDDGPEQFELLDKKNPNGKNASLGRLYKVLEEERSGLFCPLSKGFTCDKETKTCQCATQFGNTAAYNDATPSVFEREGTCFLRKGTVCRRVWETRCEPGYNCYVDFPSIEEAQKTVKWLHVERFQEVGRVCDPENIYKYLLFDDNAKTQFKPGKDGKKRFSEYQVKLLPGVDCKCKGDLPTMLRMLNDEKKSVNEKTRIIKFGESCNSNREFVIGQLDGGISEFREALNRGNRSSATEEEEGRFDFIRSTVKNLVENGSTVCDKNENGKGENLMCVDGTCKCALDSTRIPNSPEGRCFLNSTESCAPGKGNPCLEGERCVFVAYDTLCTEENIRYLNSSTEPKFEPCQCRGGNPKARFSPGELFALDERGRHKLAKEVEDEVAKGAVTFLEKDQDCTWETDRLWFQYKDFQRAGLLHIFKDMREFAELSRQLRNTVSDTKHFTACRLEKGMKCNFFTGKCECALDGHLLEDIQSVWDEGKKSCFLPKGSLCHPTLTEWLPCQEGEECLYERLQVRCNRENKRKIVRNDMRLREEEVKCRCGAEKPKDLDPKFIRDYKERRGRRDKKIEL